MNKNSENDASLLVRVEGLTHKYPGSDIFALNEVDLSIPKGVVFGLLGPNGAGKTTLITVICGIRSGNSGSVEVTGMDPVREKFEVRKKLGVVPQEIALYPSMTIMENLEHFGRMYGLSGEHLKDRISKELQTFGLWEERKKMVRRSSGGMKRRVNFIAGILHEPELLILDEPTVGVDVQSRQVILRELQRMRKEGVTVIYSSHLLEEAGEVCDHVGILDKGEVRVSGDIGTITENGKMGLKEVFLRTTKLEEPIGT